MTTPYETQVKLQEQFMDLPAKEALNRAETLYSEVKTAADDTMEKIRDLDAKGIVAANAIAALGANLGLKDSTDASVNKIKEMSRLTLRSQLAYLHLAVDRYAAEIVIQSARVAVEKGRSGMPDLLKAVNVYRGRQKQLLMQHREVFITAPPTIKKEVPLP